MSALISPPVPVPGIANAAASENPFFPWPNVELIESDGEPLESQWHPLQIMLLIETANAIFQGRDDFFASGNMFIYFNVQQARDRDYRGPDFFFVNGVNRLPARRYWAVWDEGGRYPDVIVELLSPTTAQTDRTVKKKIYETIFRTPEYFLYDPDTNELEGWHFNGNSVYQMMVPNERGWLWSKQLGRWVGLWQGKYGGLPNTWVRTFDREGNVVLIESESAQAQLKAAQTQLKMAQAQAEAAQAQAEAAQAQAEAVMAENAVLKTKLSGLEKSNRP